MWLYEVFRFVENAMIFFFYLHSYIGLYTNYRLLPACWMCLNITISQIIVMSEEMCYCQLLDYIPLCLALFQLCLITGGCTKLTVGTVRDIVLGILKKSFCYKTVMNIIVKPTFIYVIKR